MTSSLSEMLEGLDFDFTPADLADYLEAHPRKTTGRLGDGHGSFCCLGHAANLSGQAGRYDKSDGGLMSVDPRRMGSAAALWELHSALVPKGHWLQQHQSWLARLNDGTKTFSGVIEYLRSLSFDKKCETWVEPRVEPSRR